MNWSWINCSKGGDCLKTKEKNTYSNWARFRGRVVGVDNEKYESYRGPSNQRNEAEPGFLIFPFLISKGDVAGAKK